MDATRGFLIEGHIADAAVSARWVQGKLEASDELVSRLAQLSNPAVRWTHDGTNVIPASLEHGPLAALLAVTRLFDTVTRFETQPHCHYPAIPMESSHRHRPPGG